MISIRKYMDNSKDRLTEPALTGWRASLVAIAESAARAVPGLGNDLKQNLSTAGEALSSPESPEVLSSTSATVEKELSLWADKAHEHYIGSIKEIRDIIATVASASDNVARRDQTYVQQMGELNGQLQAIAKLDNLPEIRSSILESARALKACVGKMAEEGQEALRQLASEVAEYRSRLEKSEMLSSTDQLTQLPNRRAFENHLSNRIAQRQQFSLIMMDLNGFKQINDQYGHLSGDDLLRQFAGELKSQFRSNDLVARWGGDEFVAVLGANLEESQERVHQIRRWALGDYKIQSGNRTIKVAVQASIGVAEWNRMESAPELIARADAKLYSFKPGRQTQEMLTRASDHKIAKAS